MNESNFKLFFIAAIVIGLISFACNYGQSDNYSNVIVTQVDLHQKVQTTQNNGVHSKNECLVYTNCGVYNIELSGIFGNTSLVSQMQPGDTVNISTRGIRCEFIGLYPVITQVSNIRHKM